MSTLLHDFADRRQQVAVRLAALALALEPLGDDGRDAAERLSGLSTRTADGQFVVLLLGCFSAGKSTLVNALLGEPVLPVKVNPCTAVLTEVTHGSTPAVEIEHHDGSTTPLTPEAFAARFQLRTAFADEAGEEVDSRFGSVKRARVVHPCALLQHGVTLLDTPGLDDDPARTARTLSALPGADAVIVVLNATRFLTALERRTLEHQLGPLGLANLFFPVTMVDLLDALTDDPEAALADITARARAGLGTLCTTDGVDRFDERFFPLDARGGLDASWDASAGARRDPRNEARHASTGLTAFEDALARFLVEERGRAQLAHAARTARATRDQLASASALDRATFDATVEELRDRRDALTPQLDALDNLAARIGRTVTAFTARQQERVWQDLRVFLEETEDQLPTVLAGFDLGAAPALELLTPGGRLRIGERMRTQLEAWFDHRSEQWQATVRDRMHSALDALRAELEEDAAAFDALIEEITTRFAGRPVSLPDPTGEAEEVDALERWLAVAMGALLLSPGAMAAAWNEGYEGMAKGVAGRIGARLTVVALGSLLGPIGWAGLLLYAAVDTAVMVLSGESQLEALRRTAAEKVRGKLVAEADRRREEIEEKVADALTPIREGVHLAAREEAEALRSRLGRIIDAHGAAESDARTRAARWEQALEALDEGIEALDALVP